MSDTKPPSTRQRLLRAAEELFAEHGLSGTSTRAILQRAGQRNESALQYHFGGREGLLEALYVDRGAEIAAERELMLVQLLEQYPGNSGTSHPSVRQICELGLLAPVRVASRKPEVVRFLEIAGEIAVLPNERLREINQRYEFGSVRKVRQLLEEHPDLASLPGDVLRHRLVLLNRIAAIAVAQRARNDGAFDGGDADLYFGTVLDAMAAVLTAEPSKETLDAGAALHGSSRRSRTSTSGRKR